MVSFYRPFETIQNHLEEVSVRISNCIVLIDVEGPLTLGIAILYAGGPGLDKNGESELSISVRELIHCSLLLAVRVTGD